MMFSRPSRTSVCNQSSWISRWRMRPGPRFRVVRTALRESLFNEMRVSTPNSCRTCCTNLPSHAPMFKAMRSASHVDCAITGCVLAQKPSRNP
eukprot:12448855-Heterocapsa_arctica.AAC.1